MAPGGHRIPARRARWALCALATAVVAGLTLPAGAAAVCDPSLPAEGITTPASGTCSVTAGFQVTSPSVPLGAPVRVDPGGTLQVDALPQSQVTAPNNFAGFAWDFDGTGFGLDDPAHAAMHTYSVATRGVFNVRVRVTDNAGPPANIEASAPTQVFVAFPLVGGLATPTSTGAARTFQFNATASEQAAQAPATAPSFTYDWDWNGDGTYDQTNAGSSPLHTFAADGDYTVKVRITDDIGQSVVLAKTVSAFNQLPVLTTASVAPNPAFVNAPVTLTANASDADGRIVSYLWDIDGTGTIFESPAGPGGATYQVAYPNPGTIPVRIGAKDDSGGITWQTVLLTVNLPGGSNGTIDGGGALGLGAPGTATGPGAGGGGRGGVSFTARLGGTPFQKLKIVRRRGVSFTCSASHAATCSVSVWLAAKDARALRVNRKAKRPIVVAAFRADIPAGKTVAFTLKASGKLKRALARTRKLALTFQGVATEKGSARRLSLSRVIILRR